MNPALRDALKKIGAVVGSALLLALSGFLSRVLQPLIAWTTFTSLKLLIRLTKSKTLRSLYGDLKKGYDEEK